YHPEGLWSLMWRISPQVLHDHRRRKERVGHPPGCHHGEVRCRVGHQLAGSRGDTVLRRGPAGGFQFQPYHADGHAGGLDRNGAFPLRRSQRRGHRILSDMLKKTNAILDSTGEAIENIDRTAANLQDMSAKLNGGKGTVGALVNDRSVYQHM